MWTEEGGLWDLLPWTTVFLRGEGIHFSTVSVEATHEAPGALGLEVLWEAAQMHAQDSWQFAACALSLVSSNKAHLLGTRRVPGTLSDGLRVCLNVPEDPTGQALAPFHRGGVLGQ